MSGQLGRSNLKNLAIQNLVSELGGIDDGKDVRFRDSEQFMFFSTKIFFPKNINANLCDTYKLFNCVNRIVLLPFPEG